MRSTGIFKIILSVTLLTALLLLSFGLTGCGKSERAGEIYEYESGSGNDGYFSGAYLRFVNDGKVEIFRPMTFATYTVREKDGAFTERDGLFSFEIKRDTLILTYSGEDGQSGSFRLVENAGYYMAGRSFEVDGKPKVTVEGGSETVKKALEDAYVDGELTFTANRSYSFRANDAHSDDYSISVFGCKEENGVLTQTVSVFMSGATRSVRAILEINDYEEVTLTLYGIADGATVKMTLKSAD